MKSIGYDEQIEKEVKRLFITHGFDLVIHYVDTIEKTKRGKQNFDSRFEIIISKLVLAYYFMG